MRVATRIPGLRKFCILALLPAAGIACAAEKAEAPALSVEVRARALVPGEPVRIVARSNVELESLSATFLDTDVAMQRSATGDRWSGWSMIGLDQEPGEALVALTGVTERGELVAGSHAVTVAAKAFPTEELSVQSRYVEPPKEVQERLAAERAKLAEIYARRSPLESQGAFVRPVPGVNTSVFGTRRIFNGQPRSPHPGLDMRAAEGTAVRAAGAGHVALAQDLYYSGNTVLLDHGGGLFTIYAHLSELRVAEGDDVAAGQVVGLSGATGRVTGPHLHWGAKIGNRPFDPEALIDPALYD